MIKIDSYVELKISSNSFIEKELFLPEFYKIVKNFEYIFAFKKFTPQNKLIKIIEIVNLAIKEINN